MQKLIHIFLFSAFFQFLNAQLSSTILLDRDTVSVGEVITAKIKNTKAFSDKFESLDLNPLFNPLVIQHAFSTADSTGRFNERPDFEISKLGSWDGFYDQKIIPYTSINWVDDKTQNISYAENQIEMRFWDPGIYKLRGGQFNLVDSTTSVIPLEGTFLFVRQPELNIDTTKQLPIKPIKSIIRESKSIIDYWPWFLLAILLLALSALFYFIQVRKPQQTIEDIPEIIRSPYEIAIDDLDQLKKEELWQKGEIKAYQSRLTDIVRAYIDGRYDVPALELTTDETMRALKQKKFNPFYESQLVEILTMADLIKFAKAKPPNNIHERFMNTSVNFIENTKQDFHQEEE